MEITLIAIVLLVWLLVGGIVSILVCPMLKLEDDEDPSPSASFDGPRKISPPHAPPSYR
ncbi:MAG: hypothetical protein ABSA57_02800 [Candidatus Acidiferrales bacterium]